VLVTHYALQLSPLSLLLLRSNPLCTLNTPGEQHTLFSSHPLNRLFALAASLQFVAAANFFNAQSPNANADFKLFKVLNSKKYSSNED
jgi:hypothetical protein